MTTIEQIMTTRHHDTVVRGDDGQAIGMVVSDGVRDWDGTYRICPVGQASQQVRVRAHRYANYYAALDALVHYHYHPSP